MLEQLLAALAVAASERSQPKQQRQQQQPALLIGSYREEREKTSGDNKPNIKKHIYCKITYMCFSSFNSIDGHL